MRYKVTGTVTVVCETEVEAESAEQAQEIAQDRDQAFSVTASAEADRAQEWVVVGVETPISDTVVEEARD